MLPVYLDDSITKRSVFTKEQVEVVAWRMVFRTIEQADAQGKESPNHVS